MAASYDTPTKYQVDRLSEELRGVHQELRELNRKLRSAGEMASYLLIYGALIGFFGFVLVQVANRA